eukprot:7682188-Pyramimonas_sp.AAC.1
MGELAGSRRWAARPGESPRSATRAIKVLQTPSEAQGAAPAIAGRQCDDSREKGKASGGASSSAAPAAAALAKTPAER